MGPTRSLFRWTRSKPAATQARRIMRLRPSWMVRWKVVWRGLLRTLESSGGSILPSSRVGPAERARRDSWGAGFLTVTSYTFSIREDGWVLRWASGPSFRSEERRVGNECRYRW